MENFQPHSNAIRLFYFWLGVAATIAYRIIIVLSDVDPMWTKAVWYFGTIGFIFYFAHRFQISEKRARLIRTYQLDNKVQNIDCLNGEEKAAIGYILSTLASSRERWNSIIIFIASGLALLAGIYLDFIR